MAINFSVGQYVNTNQSFIQNSLSFENFSTLPQTLVTLGYLKNVVSTVTAVGNITFPSLSYIRVVPTISSNLAYNAGQGVSLYFSTDTLLNNSFEYSTAFISDTVITRVLNNSGSSIPSGSIVRQTGFDTTNQVPTIALASAAATNTSTVLGVLQGDVANNSLGSVVIQGSYSLNTTSFSAIGDSVFLSNTVGQIATAAGTVSVTIGKVLTIGTEGAISVFSSIQGGSSGGGAEADTWATVLARGATSSTNNPIVPSGSRIVFGTADVNGLSLQYVFGDIEVRSGAGVSTSVGIFGGRSDTSTTAGALKLQGGYNTSTGSAGDIRVVGGQSSNSISGNAYLLGGQTISGTPGSAFLGGNHTAQWQIESDGDFRTVAGTGLIQATSFISPTLIVGNAASSVGPTSGTINGTNATGGSGAPGGSLTLTTGYGSNGGAGGNLSLAAANGGGLGTGGTVSISAGQGGNTATGGNITIAAGRGGSEGGTPGAVTITGGAGGATTGNGGNITIQGGLPTNGNGGAIAITGRDGVGTDRNGGDITLTPGAPTGTGTRGAIKFDGRVQGQQGANIASANNITLTVGNFFNITGTTTINTISSTGWRSGSVIILEFAGNPVVANMTAGTGSQIRLNGAANFTTTAGSTLTLICTGSLWVETSRMTA